MKIKVFSTEFCRFCKKIQHILRTMKFKCFYVDTSPLLRICCWSYLFVFLLLCEYVS